MNLPGTRYWPPNSPPPEGQRVSTSCTECGLFWWIHTDMAGFKLRCECGAWLQIPPCKDEPSLLAYTQNEIDFHEPAVKQELTFNRDQGTIAVPAETRSQTSKQEIPTNLPLAAGALEDAGHHTRRRWTNRGLIELIAMMACFLLPTLVILPLTTGESRALWMPVSGLISGVLVLLVGLSSSWYTFGLVRHAKPFFFVETILGAIAISFLAIAYASFMPDPTTMTPLRDTLGLGMALFVVGFCPGIFEELAFRGLLQSRLSALFGQYQGILYTTVAFALAHGISAGSPFHLAIGLYLSWVRNRANSLIPGMVFHCLYNSILVCLV